MKKRIISLILSLICLAGLITVPASAEEEAVSSFRYDQIVQLGFMSGDEDPDYIVTRGEFADIICKVNNLGSKALSARMYTDVAFGDKYYDSIQLVSETNLMVGYEDGSFKPNEPVTVIQALKVLVEIAGYKNIALVYGGYPKGYSKKADELKLLKYTDIHSQNVALKRRDLGTILHNLMIAPTANIGFLAGEESFGYKYHGLSYVSGVVTANSVTNFSESIMTVSETQIAIDDKIVEISNFQDRFLVGHKVSAFYDDVTLKVANVVKCEENEEVLEVLSKDVSALAKNSVTFRKGSRSKTEKFYSSTIYVYNDKVVLSFDFRNLLNSRDYTLRFVNYDNKDGYDIVFIEDYYTVAVGSVSGDYVASSKIYATDSQTGVFAPVGSVSIEDEETTDTVYIVDGDYARYSKDSVKAGDVLTVVENGDYRRIILSRSNTKLTISDMDTADNGGKILICDDGEFYPVEELDVFFTQYQVFGMTAVASLDIYGNVAALEEVDESEEVCGLIVKVRPFEDYGEDRLQVRIFTENGEEITVTTAHKLSINGEAYKPKRIGEAEALLTGALDTPALYRLDEDGCLVSVTLAERNLSGNATGFFLGCTLNNALVSNAQKSFEGKIEAGLDTISFVLSGASYNPDTARVLVGNAMFDTTRRYNVEAYYKSRNNDTADYLVIKSNMNDLNYNSDVSVITNVSGAGIFDGVVCQKVEYLSAGAVKIAYANPEKHPDISVAHLGRGDTVRLSVDNFGFIRDVDQIYDYDAGRYTQSANPTSSLFTDSLVKGWGYVARISNSRARVATEKNVVKDSDIFSLPMHNLTQHYDIMIVRDERDITKGTAADVNVGDKVVYVLRSGAGKAFVVYKQK